MIGLDANVLVRYIAQDDALQSPKATALIERKLTPDDPGFISLVALAETVGVLERAYRLSDETLVAVIERLLQAEALVVQNEREVFLAAMTLKAGHASFSDALGAKSGCSYTATLDRKAARLPDFELL